MVCISARLMTSRYQEGSGFEEAIVFIGISEIETAYPLAQLEGFLMEFLSNRLVLSKQQIPHMKRKGKGRLGREKA